MNKTTCLILFLFCSCKFEPEQIKTNTCVYLEANDILFIDVPNSIGVSNVEDELDSLILIVNGREELKPDSNMNFDVRVKKPGKVNLDLLNKETGEILVSRYFRAKRLPVPTAYIKPFVSEIAKARVLRGKRIACELFNWDYSLAYPVISFNIIAYDNRGKERRIASNGTYFSEEQLTYIEQMEIGSSLIIDDIEVEGLGNRSEKVAPVIYKLIK